MPPTPLASLSRGRLHRRHTCTASGTVQRAPIERRGFHIYFFSFVAWIVFYVHRHLKRRRPSVQRLHTDFEEVNWVYISLYRFHRTGKRTVAVHSSESTRQRNNKKKTRSSALTRFMHAIQLWFICFCSLSLPLSASLSLGQATATAKVEYNRINQLAVAFQNSNWFMSCLISHKTRAIIVCIQEDREKG